MPPETQPPATGNTTPIDGMLERAEFMAVVFGLASLCASFFVYFAFSDPAEESPTLLAVLTASQGPLWILLLIALYRLRDARKAVERLHVAKGLAGLLTVVMATGTVLALIWVTQEGFSLDLGPLNDPPAGAPSRQLGRAYFALFLYMLLPAILSFLNVLGLIFALTTFAPLRRGEV